MPSDASAAGFSAIQTLLKQCSWDATGVPQQLQLCCLTGWGVHTQGT